MGFFQNEEYDNLMDYSEEYLQPANQIRNHIMEKVNAKKDDSLADIAEIEALFSNNDEFLKIILSKPTILDKVSNVLRSMSSIANMDASIAHDQNKHAENDNATEASNTTNGSTMPHQTNGSTAEGATQVAPVADSSATTPTKKQNAKQNTPQKSGAISAELLEELKFMCDYTAYYDIDDDDIYENYQNQKKDFIKYHKELRKNIKNENELISKIINYMNDTGNRLSVSDVNIIVYFYSMPIPWFFIMNRKDNLLRNVSNHNLAISDFRRYINK